MCCYNTHSCAPIRQAALQEPADWEMCQEWGNVHGSTSPHCPGCSAGPVCGPCLYEHHLRENTVCDQCKRITSLRNSHQCQLCAMLLCTECYQQHCCTQGASVPLEDQAPPPSPPPGGGGHADQVVPGHAQQSPTTAARLEEKVVQPPTGSQPEGQAPDREASRMASPKGRTHSAELAEWGTNECRPNWEHAVGQPRREPPRLRR